MFNSYKGKILISTPDASGDIFSRSVVLIIEHNESGAFGLILNKQNREMSLKIPHILGKEIQVYEGGPVARDKLFFIVRDEGNTTSGTSINNSYYMTDYMEKVVEQILEGKIVPQDVKVFSGYSGWGANQLEMEIQNKYWTVLDIINLNLTEHNDQRLWKQLMQTLGGEFLLWANAPENIHQN